MNKLIYQIILAIIFGFIIADYADYLNVHYMHLTVVAFIGVVYYVLFDIVENKKRNKK